jgi:hypothetical protein
VDEKETEETKESKDETMEENDNDDVLLDSSESDGNDDSEDEMAVDMENFAADLDSSILYTTVEQVCFVVYSCKKVLLFFTTVI